jgi:hypothetical protein
MRRSLQTPSILRRVRLNTNLLLVCWFPGGWLLRCHNERGLVRLWDIFDLDSRKLMIYLSHQDTALQQDIS